MAFVIYGGDLTLKTFKTLTGDMDNRPGRRISSPILVFVIYVTRRFLMAPSAPGAKARPYEIISRLGEGGMGEVYRARDTRLNRSVAVKVPGGDMVGDPKPECDASTSAHRRRGSIIPRGRNDVGVEGDTPYLVMELGRRARSLREQRDRGRCRFARLSRFAFTRSRKD